MTEEVKDNMTEEVEGNENKGGTSVEMEESPCLVRFDTYRGYTVDGGKTYRCFADCYKQTYLECLHFLSTKGIQNLTEEDYRKILKKLNFSMPFFYSIEDPLGLREKLGFEKTGRNMTDEEFFSKNIEKLKNLTPEDIELEKLKMEKELSTTSEFISIEQKDKFGNPTNSLDEAKTVKIEMKKIPPIDPSKKLLNGMNPKGSIPYLYRYDLGGGLSMDISMNKDGEFGGVQFSSLELDEGKLIPDIEGIVSTNFSNGKFKFKEDCATATVTNAQLISCEKRLREMKKNGGSFIINGKDHLDEILISINKAQENHRIEPQKESSQEKPRIEPKKESSLEKLTTKKLEQASDTFAGQEQSRGTMVQMNGRGIGTN